MKTKTTTLILAGLLLSAAFVTAAVPVADHTPTISRALHSIHQIEKLKAGDAVAMVCMECQSVSVMKLASADAGMKMAMEGGTVTCPVCKKSYRIVRRQGPRSGDTGNTIELSYVDDHDNEGMFITKIGE